MSEKTEQKNASAAELPCPHAKINTHFHGYNSERVHYRCGDCGATLVLVDELAAESLAETEAALKEARAEQEQLRKHHLYALCHIGKALEYKMEAACEMAWPGVGGLAATAAQLVEQRYALRGRVEEMREELEAARGRPPQPVACENCGETHYEFHQASPEDAQVCVDCLGEQVGLHKVLEKEHAAVLASLGIKDPVRLSDILGPIEEMKARAKEIDNLTKERDEAREQVKITRKALTEEVDRLQAAFDGAHDARNEALRQTAEARDAAQATLAVIDQLLCLKPSDGPIERMAVLLDLLRGRSHDVKRATASGSTKDHARPAAPAPTPEAVNDYGDEAPWGEDGDEGSGGQPQTEARTDLCSRCRHHDKGCRVEARLISGKFIRACSGFKSKKATP